MEYRVAAYIGRYDAIDDRRAYELGTLHKGNGDVCHALFVLSETKISDGVVKIGQGLRCHRNIQDLDREEIYGYFT